MNKKSYIIPQVEQMPLAPLSVLMVSFEPHEPVPQRRW